jgi:hypothetical protein
MSAVTGSAFPVDDFFTPISGCSQVRQFRTVNNHQAYVVGAAFFQALNVA